MVLVKLQMGKKGLTSEFIQQVKAAFEKNDNVRISLLKHATRDKSQVKNWTQELLDNLGKNYTAKTIGYTIVLRKWRKARTSEEE